MNGQWIGRYTGTNDGTLVVELDDAGSQYEGAAFAIADDRALPAVFGEFVAPKGQNEFKLRVPLVSIERGTGNAFPEDVFKARFPGVTPATYADADWVASPTEIRLSWSTDIGTNGTAVVSKSRGGEDSSLAALDKSWTEFKEFATDLDPARYLFRGQESNKWKVRTAFHRTGRANLLRFMRQDVGALHRHIIGLTTHRFNLGDPYDYAAFLALVQHHGYPTPLLDWTLSPFIAAYFAFRNLNVRALPADHKVRIYIFDGLMWNRSFERATALSPAFLHITVLEPLALNNPRVLPQQGYSLVTNIDDVESYIAVKETAGKQFLRAIDISIGERPRVLKELALMGINAGSLFPGLDGACNQLKERFFDI